MFFILCATFPMYWFWFSLTAVKTISSTVEFKRIGNVYRWSEMKNGVYYVGVETSF